MAIPQDNKQYEYFAFISYKREDEKWAEWLQRKLEYYKLPASARKTNPSLPERIRPVFKDTTDLEPGVLAQKIRDALDSSKFLIVICSPRSANSVWVSKEVQSFIDSGRADHIIPFIIGGTPNAANPEDECFPERLRQLAGEQELLGANINEMGRSAAAIKVIARMFDMKFDTLWQRYEKEKKRRRYILFGALTSLTIIFAILFFFIVKKDRATRAAFSTYIAQKINESFDKSDYISAIGYVNLGEKESYNNSVNYECAIQKISSLKWIPRRYTLPITNSVERPKKIWSIGKDVIISTYDNSYKLTENNIERLPYNILDLSANKKEALIKDKDNSLKIINMNDSILYTLNNPDVENASFAMNSELVTSTYYGEITIHSKKGMKKRIFTLPHDLSTKSGGGQTRIYCNPRKKEIFICNSHNCLKIDYSYPDSIDTTYIIKNNQTHISDIIFSRDGEKTYISIGEELQIYNCILNKITDCVKFDNTLIACSPSNNDNIIYASDNEKIYEYNVTLKKIETTQIIEAEGQIETLYFDELNNKIWLGLPSRLIKLSYNTSHPEPQLIQKVPHRIRSITHHPNKPIIAYVSADSLYLLDYQPHTSKISSISNLKSYNVNIKLLDQNILMWNDGNYLCTYDVKLHRLSNILKMASDISDYCVIPKSNRILAVSDKTIIEYDYKANKIIKRYTNLYNVKQIRIVSKTIIGITKYGNLIAPFAKDSTNAKWADLSLNSFRWSDNGNFILYKPSFFSNVTFLCKISSDEITFITIPSNHKNVFITNEKYARIDDGSLVEVYNLNTANLENLYRFSSDIKIEDIFGFFNNSYIFNTSNCIYRIKIPSKEKIIESIMELGQTDLHLNEFFND